MSSSAPRPSSAAEPAATKGENNDDTVAKTAGFVVFSDIAMSIVKALIPKFPQQTPLLPQPPPPPLHDFSDIATSIVKALTPKFPRQTPLPPQPSPPPPLHDSSVIATNTVDDFTPKSPQQTPLLPPSSPPPLPHDSSKKPPVRDEVGSGLSTSSRTVDIVVGDTLWGLSRKYGVSIEEIKKANRLTGDTIYAGRKLVIP